MHLAEFQSKTYSPADLTAPAAARAAGALRRFALRLGLSATPFAVNGFLRLRFWVAPHKLWEYARGVACVQQTVAREAAPARRLRVLDFGGGATLPVYFLAAQGADVLSLDVDRMLADATNAAARARGWRLQGSTFNLVQSPPPPEWGRFDAVLSFSVLEHLPKPIQPEVMARLASLVRPGGILVLTFDYGEAAPKAEALRDAAEVERLVEASGLALLDSQPFRDTGERFVLDKRHPNLWFTFGSLFLKRTSE